MLISNSEIMEQLYRMGDTFKKFAPKLDSIESEHCERYEKLSQGNHRHGKEVVAEESESSQPDKHIKRFQAVTPKRLTYEEESPKAKGHDKLGGM